LLRKEPGDRPDSAFVVARRLTDISQGGNGSFVKRVAEPAAPVTPPRGILEKPRSASLPASARRRKWLVPLLGGLLCLSLAWNVRSLDSEASGKQAEQLWIQAYHSGRAEMQEQAAKALGQLAPNSPQALDLLISALDDRSPAIRSTAIEGLTLAGTAARPAIGDLLRLQNSDENEFIRTKAALAIKAIRESKGQHFSGASLLFWALIMLVVAAGVVALTALRDEKKGAAETR
jgi:hypothetical protein